MKVFRCSQWLVIDNQQLCFNVVFATSKHYKNKADVNKDYAPEKTEFCFHPLRPIRESLLTGEFAENVYCNERKGSD